MSKKCGLFHYLIYFCFAAHGVFRPEVPAGRQVPRPWPQRGPPLRALQERAFRVQRLDGQGPGVGGGGERRGGLRTEDLPVFQVTHRQELRSRKS